MARKDFQGIGEELRAALRGLSPQPDVHAVGTVTRVSDGIVWIWGLKECGYNEMITIETAHGSTVTAFALNLEEDQIGAVVLGASLEVAAGARAHLTGQVLAVPVGEALLGRVVNPLGEPLDGLGQPTTTETGAVEKIAPGVLARDKVNQSLATGIKALDVMLPIGRGQRELLIGDRQTGKTALAVDAIINQARQKTGVISIYVSIGQKMSTVARIVERLKQEGALEQTIIVLTSAADPAALQYVAPYAACAMGEYFRDKGRDVLIVYDDLSKHAWAYRQLSLLLRRPPGREAYPGDIFYLHSRLLERAGKLNAALGSGSLTALPIIETQANDVSAYVPTNVISITDGQIYLESDLFYQGIRPAVNVGLSVSRVGGAAQSRAMKKIAGSLRLELAQYRELAAFAQFATDLEAETKKRIERGKRLTELLKQEQYQPLSLMEQLVVLVAATRGIFDTVPVAQIRVAEQAVREAVLSEAAEVVARIAATGELREADIEQLLVISRTVCQRFIA